MGTVGDRQAMSDPDLIRRSRTGDVAAFAELRRRHEPAAQAAARALCDRSGHVAEVVDEAFACMLRVLEAGDGPDVAFRPYLLVAVRNRVHDRRAPSLVDSVDAPTEQLDLQLLDSVVAAGDGLLVGTAFAALPERWQLVVWHADVERVDNQHIAPLVGLAATAVPGLTCRAREGLRQAYVRAWLSTPRDAPCIEIGTLLAPYVRDTISVGDRAVVAEHLQQCASCARLVGELAGLQSATRAGLLEAFLGVSSDAYVVRKRSAMHRWFGGLSGWQRVAALSGVAAAAVFAGVVTAAAMGSSDDRPSAAAQAPTTATSAPRGPVTVTSAEEAPTTTFASTTTGGATTIGPTTTRVMPTLPPGTVSRVPNSTTTAPSTSTTSTTVVNNTTVPATTLPPVPRITVMSSQLGVAVAGGQVRVQLDVSGFDLPIARGDRAFTGLGVSVQLPAGVSLVAADNPAWTCTATGNCTVASLADGATSSSALILALPADPSTSVTLQPSVTNPVGAQVQAAPLSFSSVTIDGLAADEYARGSVTAIGNTVVDCTGPCQLVDVDGDPTTATSSRADLTITGQVAHALLVWSGVSNSANRDQVVLTGPAGAMDISAGSVTSGAVPGNAYTAIADVTAEVAAGGTYTVGGIRTTASGPAGWSLIVITHDDSQPLRQMLIVAPNAFVTPLAPYSLTAATPAATSDVHLVVSAFGGTALTGDVVTLDGLAVADAFHGAITSAPRLPELAFNKGVDLLDVSAADVGSGSGALTIASSDDSVLVAAVGLAVDVV